jgi:hypothetical protein
MASEPHLIIAGSFMQATLYAASRHWRAGSWEYLCSPALLRGTTGKHILLYGTFRERSDWDKFREAIVITNCTTEEIFDD